MKKIIISTDTWRPNFDGVIRHIEELSLRLESKGFEVVILHPRLFFSIPVIFYPEYSITFFAKSKIKKIIKTEKPDYIHIATWGPLGLSARRACLDQKNKFTTAYPTHFPEYAKIYILKSKFLFDLIYAYLRWFHNAGNRTMVSTESLKKEADEYGFKNVVVSPLGVDVDFFKENASVSKEHDGFKHPIFAYLGRLAKEKNVEEFLECVLPGTKLIIGDGPIRPDLEKKYCKNTFFAGKKMGKELVDLLSVCDVLVFPSLTDTFGLAIVEALACGIPVAAHNVIGPKDIITNGVDGFLDENIEEAAIKCLSISREKCREKALKFSWEKSADYFIRNLVKT